MLVASNVAVYRVMFERIAPYLNIPVMQHYFPETSGDDGVIVQESAAKNIGILPFP
jgi:hypothetical protein